MNLIITAGFEKSENALAISEMLYRQGHNIIGIIVVSSMNWKRFRFFIRQRGFNAALKLSKKIFSDSNEKKGPLFVFLDKNNINQISLKKWCKKNGSTYIKVNNLNDTKSLNFVKKIHPDYIIYGGGGILKEKFINLAENKIINAHSGPLPFIRGMNACEWSILLGYEPCVTVHFIDTGIDTGDILLKRRINIEKKDTIKTLREKCTVSGVESILEVIEKIDEITPEKTTDAANYRQCFIMADVVKEILQYKLKKGNF